MLSKPIPTLVIIVGQPSVTDGPVSFIGIVNQIDCLTISIFQLDGFTAIAQHSIPTGNDRLDIGDGTLVQRLLTGFDEKRSWDSGGNDLNGNGKLDQGEDTDWDGVLDRPNYIDPEARVEDFVPEGYSPSALLCEEEKIPVAGTVIWITPKGAQGNRTAGIGVQFSDQEPPTST